MFVWGRSGKSRVAWEEENRGEREGKRSGGKRGGKPGWNGRRREDFGRWKWWEMIRNLAVGGDAKGPWKGLIGGDSGAAIWRRRQRPKAAATAARRLHADN